MIRRRAIRPEDGVFDEPSDTATVIVENDDDDGFTGLLDAQGKPIMRKRFPIGFQGATSCRLR